MGNRAGKGHNLVLFFLLKKQVIRVTGLYSPGRFNPEIYSPCGFSNKSNSSPFLSRKPSIFCLNVAALTGFSISIFLFLLIVKYSSSRSIPKNRRFDKLAATPVVELPVKRSKTQAPGLVEAKISLVSNESGFCVGCLPQDFSQGAWQAASKRLLSVCSR